ncbi:hypothetical protein XIS1_1300006 [Xenorhabdus innexi]|uniref:Uncharacterized protein n=1 Tax=Xenorhabdus innexi TaxID=290109 RepID=A0A1N6MSZ8_9GAMM|nr:hypothetical protein Xinn_01500 [Xenorhabdus innexi]SIP71951.1 hypothetical protein XIS1_1300006 [Xenorhabdus innexi]
MVTYSDLVSLSERVHEIIRMENNQFEMIYFMLVIQLYAFWVNFMWQGLC